MAGRANAGIDGGGIGSDPTTGLVEDAAVLERIDARGGIRTSRVAIDERAVSHRRVTYAPWGMLSAIDLHGCDRDRLADPDRIRRFVPAVIDAIGMRAHGPLHLDRFGDGELEGWSALQFIETSSITIHADEVHGRCFVDVFSCRSFNPTLAASVAVAYFGGTVTTTVLVR